MTSIRKQLINTAVNAAPLSSVRETINSYTRVKEELKELAIDESIVFNRDGDLRPIFQGLRGKFLVRAATYFAYLQALRNLRKYFKVTQEEIAEQLEMTVTEFSNIECGIRMMDLHHLEVYLDLFYLSMADYEGFKARNGTVKVEEDDYPFDDLREHVMHHPPRFTR